MIKAILFDYDGVMTQGIKDGVPASRLAKKLNISAKQATDLILSVWEPYSTGTFDDATAWGVMEQQYGKKINSEQRDIWFTWEELKPLPEMIELVGTLKSNGYTVGLLSNVLPVTAELIRDNGGYQNFDFLTLSCEVGARKPDQKIYETALAQLNGIAANEVVFLDDRQICITGAQKVGIKTIHVINHEAAIAEVHKLIGAL